MLANDRGGDPLSPMGMRSADAASGWATKLHFVGSGHALSRLARAFTAAAGRQKVSEGWLAGVRAVRAHFPGR